MSTELAVLFHQQALLYWKAGATTQRLLTACFQATKMPALFQKASSLPHHAVRLRCSVAHLVWITVLVVGRAGASMSGPMATRMNRRRMHAHHTAYDYAADLALEAAAHWMTAPSIHEFHAW